MPNLRNKLNDYYSKNSEYSREADIVIREFNEQNTEQNDAKIIETEEAEENDLVMHRGSKSNNDISSIDFTNGLGEISDYNSAENYMLNGNMESDKKPSFITSTEMFPSLNHGSEKSNSKDHHQDFEASKKPKSSICLSNMLFFRSKNGYNN